MKEKEKSQYIPLPSGEVWNICGGRIASAMGIPWGQILMYIINEWSDIKSGFSDGFNDGLSKE